MSKVKCSNGCAKMGPGYASPMDAMKHGPKEKLLYVCAIQPNYDEPHGNYLATVDVDPASPTYLSVIHRTCTYHPKDEMHHSSWNACSSCHNIEEGQVTIPKRDKLILPCLNSGTIYVIDVAKDDRKPELFKRIDGEQLQQYNVSAPHSAHCLADGHVMISLMGDANGDSKGEFILLNSKFELDGTWTKGDNFATTGYDFWYQPYHNIMVSSGFGPPKLFNEGFHPLDIPHYGTQLNFYQWNEKKLIQTIDLAEDGITPLEVRFLHDPKENQGYVCCALTSNVYRFYKNSETNKYVADKVIDQRSKTVEGWVLPEMPGMTGAIIISMDDRFLYLTNWFHGDVRQYDISDRAKPKQTGQVFVGGIPATHPKVKVILDNELNEQPPAPVILGKTLEGGPGMMQLSLDGKRLYVSSSVYSPWDKQFYPEMVQNGGYIVQIDVDDVNSGMKINTDFLVDFGKEPYGPTLPHEMRYPGGDCTSDIFLANE